MYTIKILYSGDWIDGITHVCRIADKLKAFDYVNRYRLLAKTVTVSCYGVTVAIWRNGIRVK